MIMIITIFIPQGKTNTGFDFCCGPQIEGLFLSCFKPRAQLKIVPQVIVS